MIENHYKTDFMRVRPPSAPPQNLRRADVTPTRLARNVALLFGVDIPENPVAATWVSEYSALTVAEIARGAPLPPRRSNKESAVPAGRWALIDRAVVKGKDAGGAFDPTWKEVAGCDEIAAATLNRFEPDTRAALVLTGVNELFDTVHPVFRDVIDVVGVSEDGEPLADFMRVAVWAILVTEVYRNQSAVFSAAVKARAVQRATEVRWRPHVPAKFAHDVARTEFDARPETSTTSIAPATVHIFDEMMLDVVCPVLVGRTVGSETEGGSGSSNAYLIEDLIDRWCRYLTRSTDQGLSWVVDAGDGRRRVETYVASLAPLSAFMHEVINLNSELRPYGAGAGDPWVPFDIAQPDHRRRVRPRIPSVAEMRRLEPRSQQAVILTILQLHRLLTVNDAFTTSDNELFEQARREVLADREALGDLSATLLGASHPLTVRATHMSATGQAEFLHERDPVVAEAHWRSVVETASQYRRLMDDGAVAPGLWVEQVTTASPALNKRIQGLRANGDVAEAQRLLDELIADWHRALSILTVDLDAALATVRAEGTLPEYLFLLPGALHNFLGLMLQSRDPVHLRTYIEYGVEVILPVRMRIAATRKSDTAPRLTMQVLLRGIDRALAVTTDGESRQWLLDRCHALLEQYVRTTVVSAIVRDGAKPPKLSPGSVAQIVLSLVPSVLNLRASGMNTVVAAEVVGTLMTIGDEVMVLPADGGRVAGMSARQREYHQLKERVREASGAPAT